MNRIGVNVWMIKSNVWKIHNRFEGLCGALVPETSVGELSRIGQTPFPTRATKN